jgi:DNA/RNA-binding domain of Phe-tRNA-synthetase-like protein
MLEITATTKWNSTYPGSHIGILEIARVDNTAASAALEIQKRQVEQRLRSRYAGFTRREFLSIETLSAYEKYYKRFDKTYHVQLQVESVVLKGKNLPSVSPLVDAVFAAEVETFILTAGHDVARLQPPLAIDITREGDSMPLMNKVVKALPAGDMLMRDRQGIICTILYGQDNISPIMPGTTQAVYVAYAPVGVAPEQVEKHLAKIEYYVRLFAPGCQVEQSRLITA